MTTNHMKPVRAWMLEGSDDADMVSSTPLDGFIPVTITDARWSDTYKLHKRVDGSVAVIKYDENGEPCAGDTLRKEDGQGLFIEFLEAVLPMTIHPPQAPSGE